MVYGKPFVATQYFQSMFCCFVNFADLCMVRIFPLFTIITENLTK